jgi:DNA gyrase/topoisomerase IV subunit B
VSACEAFAFPKEPPGREIKLYDCILPAYNAAGSAKGVPMAPLECYAVTKAQKSKLAEALQAAKRAGRKALTAKERAKALVVLATGLGKTWLAAFDSARSGFARVIFIAHRDELLATVFKGKKTEIGRFKGLGEMMASQLKETTMDPKKRTLARVTVPASEDEIEDLVERLMGKKAEARFQFIQDNAQFAVADLDV